MASKVLVLMQQEWPVRLPILSVFGVTVQALRLQFTENLKPPMESMVLVKASMGLKVKLGARWRQVSLVTIILIKAMGFGEQEENGLDFLTETSQLLGNFKLRYYVKECRLCRRT